MDNTHNIIEYHFHTKNTTTIKKDALRKFGKPTQHVFTQYIYHDLYYEYYNSLNKKTVKTYRKSSVNSENNDLFTKMTFLKHKIPYYQFPSSNQLNEVSYITRTSFCIHFNVYLNFETRITDNQSFERIYVNINIDNKIDDAIILEAVQKIMKIMV